VPVNGQRPASRCLTGELDHQPGAKCIVGLQSGRLVGDQRGDPKASSTDLRNEPIQVVVVIGNGSVPTADEADWGLLDDAPAVAVHLDHRPIRRTTLDTAFIAC
jgi:hypothetical protein